MNIVGDYWEQILKINEWQQKRFSKKIVQKLFGTIAGKKLAIFGFAFKANTNDIRESPAIKICNSLLEEGAILSIYDPVVKKEQIKAELINNFENENMNNDNLGYWNYSSNKEDAVKNTDAVIILTEWAEFKEIEWDIIFNLMRKPSWIFDSRNIVDKNNAKSCGFNVWTLGSDDPPNLYL